MRIYICTVSAKVAIYQIGALRRLMVPSKWIKLVTLLYPENDFLPLSPRSKQLNVPVPYPGQNKLAV